MTFSFDNDCKLMYTTEILKLTNKANAAAEFEFVTRHRPSLFKVTPQKSLVESGKTLEVEFQYHPKGFNKTKVSDVENIELQIEDGEIHLIKLEGTTNETKVTLLDTLDFGIVPVS